MNNLNSERKKLEMYISALETFCAYSINEEIYTFWNIVARPQLISKWRRRTALRLYNREFCSRKYYPGINQNPGIILSLSGFLKEELRDDTDEEGNINASKDDYIDTIKDIDCQICKALMTELCDPESIHGEDLTNSQRTKAIAELRKPLLYVRN